MPTSGADDADSDDKASAADEGATMSLTLSLILIKQLTYEKNL
jgi:hypothetical protein